MPDSILDGSARTVDLGGQFALRAPGLKGHVVVHGRRAPGTRGPEAALPDLDAALAATDMTELRTIELAVVRVPPPPQAAPLRGPTGEDALLLETPDLGPDAGQVVLAIDEGGVLTWHYPLDDAGRPEPATVRGASGRKRFLIRRHVPAAPPPGTPATRGLIGAIGRKLLKVFVYPAIDPVLGAMTERSVGAWEARKRPHRARRVTPEDFGSPVAEPLSEQDWRTLAGGRALLFVHGTFSSTHAAFRGLPRETVAELSRRYEGRVFAFDHPSLSVDPAENARWLLRQVPAGLSIEVDVVCHSRGGLVSRCLAERAAELSEPGARTLRVRRVVLVGVPNRGTLLAHPDRVPGMLDRLTTLLNLDPVGVVGDVLEAILTVVKVLGRAGLVHLDGLAAMNPEGDFLRRLNGAGAVSGPMYFALFSDFEPAPGALADFVKDGLMDRIFRDAANDLVVPSEGVFGANGSSLFPMPDERRHQFAGAAGVTHGSYFARPQTSERLLEWLA